VDSESARADEGARLELEAAVAAGRRVFVAYSGSETETEARERWPPLVRIYSTDERHYHSQCTPLASP
jgi:hypothetical protein